MEDAPDTYRIVYMGTPDFAVPALEKLAGRHEVLAVVCQPDRPRGRGRESSPPAVKCAGSDRGVEILQPGKLSGEPFLSRLTELAPDVIVVAAYGKILKKDILDLPPHGCLNIHASLLPKYRGAAPINWCIVNGESETGVTIMRMDEGMDTGPMLLQKATPIGEEETAGELFDRLAKLGAEAIVEALDLLREGRLTETPQDDAAATFAPMLSRDDGRVDWSKTPNEIVNHVRGMSPWPGSFSDLDGTRVKIHRARAAAGVSSGEPGTVVDSDGRLVVAAGGGAVELVTIQLPGKKAMAAADVLRGHPVPAGARFQ